MSRDRPISSFWIGSLLALLALALSVSPAWSAPASPDPIVVEQPDGTRFLARSFGDEWANGTETIDGYTVIRNQMGHWRYADVSGGILVPSPYVVGRDLPF